LQILGNLLLETRDDGRLGLMAYDLEIGIETTVAAEVDRPGALTIPARVLSEVVSILPEAPVHLEVDDRHVTQVTCERSQYQLHGLPAEEFPRLPQLEGGTTVKVSGEIIGRLIRETRFASSADDPRKVLTGMLTILDGGEIQLVATDGYRLAWSRDAIEGEAPSRMEAIVPARAFGEVARLITSGDASVEVTLSESQVRFVIGDACIQSRLIEGQYPNWERVIPASHDKVLVISVDELRAAAKRVAVVAREDGNKVIMDGSADGLTLLAKSQVVGQAQEDLGVRFDGEPITIGFNSRYLLQAMEVIESEEVRLELKESDNPGVLKPVGRENYICLLMPMGVAQG
jgi:DNA polymerase-3 subunit beta